VCVPRTACPFEISRSIRSPAAASVVGFLGRSDIEAAYLPEPFPNSGDCEDRVGRLGVLTGRTSTLRSQ
jgi:hypothetical protein